MGQACCQSSAVLPVPIHPLFYLSKDGSELITCDPMSAEGKRIYNWDYVVQREAKYCALFNGNLLIVGGKGTLTVSTGNFHSSKDVVEFDPRTSRFEIKQKMRVGRVGHTVVCDEQTVYAISGLSDQRGTLTCERFRLPSNIWEDIDSVTTSRIHAAACIFKQRIYLVGGLGETLLFLLVSVEFYDVLVGRWVVSDLRVPMALMKHGCVAYDGGIMVFGGVQTDDRANHNAFWMSTQQNKVMQKPGFYQEGEFSSQILTYGKSVIAYDSKTGRRLFIFEDERWTTLQIKISNLTREQ